MSAISSDISPSGSSPSSPERSLEFIGNLRGLEVVKKQVGANAEDLKVISIYLSTLSDKLVDEQEAFQKTINWIVNNKERLMYPQELNAQNLEYLAGIVTSLLKLKKVHPGYQLKDSVTDNLFEIISKYFEVDTDILHRTYKVSLVNDFNNFSPDLNKRKHLNQSFILLQKISPMTG